MRLQLLELDNVVTVLAFPLFNLPGGLAHLRLQLLNCLSGLRLPVVHFVDVLLQAGQHKLHALERNIVRALVSLLLLDLDEFVADRRIFKIDVTLHHRHELVAQTIRTL